METSFEKSNISETKIHFLIDGKKEITLIKLLKGAFSKSIYIVIQISYLRLNSTSSVSIFQMSLASLQA